MKPLLFLKNGYVKAAWPLNFPIRRNGPGAHGGASVSQIPGGFPQGLLIPGPAGPVQGAAADRTAAFLLPRAGVDQSLPYMALGTLPPDPAVAADRYHFRCQAPVEGRVPLGRHVWRLGGKVVEAGKDLPPRTVGTAHPLLHPWENGGSPGVAQGASPPDLAHGPRRHLPGRQGGVFLGIPL